MKIVVGSPRRLAGYCLIFTLAWLMIACRPITAEQQSIAPDISAQLEPRESATPAEPAFNFRLTMLDGNPVALEELRGCWVVINFWATWCGPCRAEMPYLQHLADTYARDLAVVAVNMRESPAEVRAFVSAYELHMPVALEPDDETLIAYDVRGLPLTYFIAPDGTVALRHPGPLVPATTDSWLQATLAAERSDRLLAQCATLPGQQNQ